MPTSYPSLLADVEFNYDDTPVSQRVRDQVLTTVRRQQVARLPKSLALVEDQPSSVLNVFEYGLRHPGGISAKEVERALGLSDKSVKKAHKVLRDRGLADSQTTYYRGGRTVLWSYETGVYSRALVDLDSGNWGDHDSGKRDQGASSPSHERLITPVTCGNEPILATAGAALPKAVPTVSPVQKDQVVVERVSRTSESHELSVVGARGTAPTERLPWEPVADALLAHYRKLLGERGFTLSPGWAEQHRGLYVELLTGRDLDVEEAYRLAWALEECVVLTERPYLLQTVRTFLDGNAERPGELTGLVNTGTRLDGLLRRAETVGRRELMESLLDPEQPTGRRWWGARPTTAAKTPAAPSEDVRARNARLRERALATRRTA